MFQDRGNLSMKSPSDAARRDPAFAPQPPGVFVQPMTITHIKRPAEDRLMALHVQIARRADELAQQQAAQQTRETDLQLWLEAEREVLGRLSANSAA
jgi:hypothetical protein